MFGVGHDDCDLLVENVPHRNPISSRALHNHRGAVADQQPLQTAAQLLYGGAEGSRLLHRFDLGRPGQDGYCNLALADIDTSATLMNFASRASRAPSLGSLSAGRTSLTSGVKPPHRTSVFPGLRAQESTPIAETTFSWPKVALGS